MAYPSPDSPVLPQIDHFVVVMFENRSFDNVLGGLYPELTARGKYRGVRPTDSNRVDPYSSSNFDQVTVFQGTAGVGTQIMPYPDPGEEFSDMNQQIFAPGQAPAQGAGSPTMNGFAYNYAQQPPSPDHVRAVARHIMQYYAPGPTGNLPVSSALGQAYAVSDAWHAAAPVQTLSNRTFVHAATPTTYEQGGKTYSRVNNGDWTRGHVDPDGTIVAKTIFELLDQKFGSGQINWRVYYHDWPLSALFKYVDEHWHHFERSNVELFEGPLDLYGFEHDVKHGTLPAYSFIEPRYTDYLGGQPSSYHPGGSKADNGPPPVSVCYGEKLLARIYSILASEPALFEKTLFIVTYDEHGGVWDHVSPPPAVSPFPPRSVVNFDYSRYGVRVPAMFMNPYIAPGTIFRPPGSTPFDHTSIISTLTSRFGLAGPLTPRDASAPTFGGILNSSTKSPTATLPSFNCTPPRGEAAPEATRARLVGSPNALNNVFLRELERPRNAERVAWIRANTVFRPDET